MYVWLSDETLRRWDYGHPDVKCNQELEDLPIVADFRGVFNIDYYYVRHIRRKTRLSVSRTVIQPSHDGLHLFCAGHGADNSPAVIMINTCDGSIVRWFESRVPPMLDSAETYGIGSLFLSHDGRTLFGTSPPLLPYWYHSTQELQGIIYRWDVKSGAAKVPFVAHALAVHGLALSHDGSVLYTASEDKTVGIWNLGKRNGSRKSKPKGKPTLIWTLKGHEHPVCQVSMTPDGLNVMSVDSGGILRLWELKQYQCVQTISIAANARHMVASLNEWVFLLGGKAAANYTQHLDHHLRHANQHNVELVRLCQDSQQHNSNAQTIAIPMHAEYVCLADAGRAIIAADAFSVIQCITPRYSKFGQQHSPSTHMVTSTRITPVVKGIAPATPITYWFSSVQSALEPRKVTASRRDAKDNTARDTGHGMVIALSSAAA